MKKIILLLCGFTVSISFALSQRSDIFVFKTDVGKPKNLGSYVYNTINQSYIVRGSGYNIWFDRDEFHFMYNKMAGDFILTANFEFIGKGTNPHRKVGFMARESVDGKAPHVSAALHGNGLTVMQWRDSTGSKMRDPQNELFAPDSAYNIIQLERTGNNFIMRAAHTGEPLQEIGTHVMENLSGEVLAGMFICSHDPEVIVEARVWNLRIDKPSGDNYNPDKEGYPGSRLEIMNVETGARRIILEKPGRFEAPNWMPDGKKLLFNMDGLLYTIPATGGETEKLNTGFADRINNDHGISFDGKWLAISHQREGLPGGGSTVYVLPLSGGKPRLITEETPSYWHGWSPDGKSVIYVAQRKGIPIYNIYRNSVQGGKEVALTDIKQGEHVDGCEYSPDGSWIYYNSSHSGKMHIWRMKPDGSGREEITHDDFNDWFPHISPDGKWIVFLSFPPETDPNSHPPYKRVMLRLMPSSGGKPKVIAYLYGGQGTINVPSWSPDSRQIAFVSNSGR